MACNGWTNYATWRVNLELVDDYVWSDPAYFRDQFGDDFTTETVAEHLKDWVCDALTIDSTDLTTQYALAFIEDVDFHEIAEHVIESMPDDAS